MIFVIVTSRSRPVGFSPANDVFNCSNDETEKHEIGNLAKSRLKSTVAYRSTSNANVIRTVESVSLETAKILCVRRKTPRTSFWDKISFMTNTCNVVTPEN